MADKDRSDIEEAETGNEPTAETGESSAETARREARRRILMGGLASAPLLLTLSSRPALGTGGYTTTQNCGPSGMLSGNISTTAEPIGCRGKTPGYWKTKVDKCNQHFNAGPYNPINYRGGVCDDYSVPSKYALKRHIERLKRNYWSNYYKIKDAEKYLEWLSRYPGLDSPPFGTSFREIFGSGYTQVSTTTCMQALWLDDSGSSGPAPVLAHCVAAYCNAREFGSTRFGLSPYGVVEFVQSMISVDPYGLKDILEAMNERG